MSKNRVAGITKHPPKCQPSKQLKNMATTMSVHDMAQGHSLELTTEEAKLIGSALSLMSNRRGLPVTTKQHVSAKANANFDPGLPVGKTNKKKNYQSYQIHAYDSVLLYDFQQICLILSLL